MRQKDVKQLIATPTGIDAEHRIEVAKIRKLAGEREGPCEDT